MGKQFIRVLILMYNFCAKSDKIPSLGFLSALTAQTWYVKLAS